MILPLSPAIYCISYHCYPVILTPTLLIWSSLWFWQIINEIHVCSDKPHTALQSVCTSGFGKQIWKQQQGTYEMTVLYAGGFVKQSTEACDRGQRLLNDLKSFKEITWILCKLKNTHTSFWATVSLWDNIWLVKWEVCRGWTPPALKKKFQKILSYTKHRTHNLFNRTRSVQAYLILMSGFWFLFETACRSDLVY